MRRLALFGYIFGLGLTAAIVAWHGFDLVGAALRDAGPHLFWVPAYFLVPLTLSGVAWRVIFPRGTAPSMQRLITASWIGMAVNWLLPVAQIGGEIAKAVWLARRAKPPPLMVAGAIVDKTLQTGTQALVALVGVALLLGHSTETVLVPGAIAFAVILLALLGLFFVVQRRGLLAWPTAVAVRFFERAAGAALPDLAGDAAVVDAGIRAICAAPARVCVYVVIRLASRLLMAGEIWLTLYILGHPISLAEAILIECLAQTVRSAAFFVPGAYGVQESAFVLLGAMVAIPPQFALTVSLAKRLRELVIGLPALLFLQGTEAQWGWRPKPAHPTPQLIASTEISPRDNRSRKAA